MDIEIREERSGDFEAIDQVNAMAFDGFAEHELVRALRDDDAVALSLVADEDGDIVGHILFSPVAIKSAGLSRKVVALGPMSVVPSMQRAGVGSRLVEEGLRRLRKAGCVGVIVLGHPGYYPRFGFERADAFGLRCQFPTAADAFMALELVDGALAGLDGVVVYHSAFRRD